MAEPVTTDKRIEILARILRNYEDDSCGWINTTKKHQEYLLDRAEKILSILDANQ